MQVLKTVAEATKVFHPLKTTPHRLALVPTMGCLHEGHLALVKLAQQHADKVVVSIFVNPLQFGPGEDFEKYPRTFEEDKQKLEAVGVNYLFHPEVRDLYPSGFNSTLTVGPLAKQLCGRVRPGHFDGVATICLKLFQITQADLAIFGEKDYQQLQVIRQVARDFNLPLTIMGHPTLREPDGLAMSSRNSYMSADERGLASVIPKALNALRETIRSNPRVLVADLLEQGRSLLQGLEIQYLEITSGTLLQSAPGGASVAALCFPRVFLAVTVGNTRLIDNMSLEVQS